MRTTDEIDQLALSNGTTGIARIRSHRGRTVLKLDGRPVNPVMYCPPSLGRRDAEPMWRRTAERMLSRHRVDICLVSVPQRWEDKWDLNPFWDGDRIDAEPRHLDSKRLDAGPNFVLEHAPATRVMIRFLPRPPRRWLDLHPRECVVTEAGERIDYPSLASTVFRDMAAAYCAAIIRYCESRPWADRCLGYINYHLCEGTHGPLTDSWLFDHSPAMTARWRAFLRRRYANAVVLRQAHGDATLSFDTIAVPCDRLNGPRRDVAECLYWQSAAENQALRDYLLLVRELLHEQFRAMAAASKPAAPDKLHLHDTFKLPMQGWSNAGFFSLQTSWPVIFAETMAGSGNMDVSPLLDMSEVDGLATPYDYQARGAGGIFEPEGIADSTVLRGRKLFFVEQDVRTYAGGVHNCGMMRNLKEFEAVTWRDLAAALTRGFMNYLTDHNADYFSDPSMQAIVARQFEVLKQSIHWPHATVPGIAMILDEQAALETNGAGQVMNEAVMWEQKTGISRCGVPYRIYLLDDLRRDDFPGHGVFYFPNLYRMDEERLALLHEKVLRHGHVVVWGPGSGISDGATIGAESASHLTGFQFSMQPLNVPRRVQICDFTHPVTEGMPSDTIYGGAVAYGPALYPTDGHPLGWAWSKFGGDDIGLSFKSFGAGARGAGSAGIPRGAGDYAAFFTTAAPLPAALWRGVARYAGVHVYCDENDVVLADCSVVALHTLKSGPRTIALPGDYDVIDLVSGESVIAGARSIEFEAAAPSTHVFLITDTTR